MVKDSEWGAVVYLTQSNYGRNGTEVTINAYYTNSISQSPYRTAMAGLANIGDAESSTQSLTNVSAYNTSNGYKGSSTGNITGVYDISGGLWERTSGYISDGSSLLTSIGVSNGSSSTLMGATSTANANGYQTLSTRNYTVYPYNGTDDDSEPNYIIYKGLLSSNYGYGDSILEISSGGTGTTSWNSDYSQFASPIGPFFARGGNYGGGAYAGPFAFYYADGGANYGSGFRVALIAE